MRVAVCTDSIGALASRDAGAAIGLAFLDVNPATQVAVVPMAAGGPGLAAALAALGDDAVVVRDPAPRTASGLEREATSCAVGKKLAAALASGARRVVVDLTGVATHDGGAGILHALGARGDAPLDAGVAGLADLSRVDLGPALAAVAGAEIVAVVAGAELGDHLLGLRGLTARRGHPAGVPVADLLAADAALGRLAAALGVADAPGLGAAGGTPTALTALGAWVTSGTALCAGVAGLERTASAADVIVTGADEIDFATRGGDVVREVSALAERVLTPCVAIARSVHVSARELRTFGIEVAYAVGGPPGLDAAALTEGARGAASSWTW